MIVDSYFLLLLSLALYLRRERTGFNAQPKPWLAMACRAICDPNSRRLGREDLKPIKLNNMAGIITPSSSDLRVSFAGAQFRGSLRLTFGAFLKGPSPSKRARHRNDGILARVIHQRMDGQFVDRLEYDGSRHIDPNTMDSHIFTQPSNEIHK